MQDETLMERWDNHVRHDRLQLVTNASRSLRVWDSGLLVRGLVRRSGVCGAGWDGSIIVDRPDIVVPVSIVWGSGRRTRVGRVVRGTDVMVLLFSVETVRRGGGRRHRGRRTGRR